MIMNYQCKTCKKLDTVKCPVELATDDHCAERISELCGLVCHSNFHPYNPQAPDLSHITPERRGCLTCLAPDCPVWQAADQNCWKPQSNPQAEQSCIWTEDDDGIYQTSCGNAFEVMNGTPEFNNMKFCPYCGKVLRQSKEIVNV